MGHSTEYIGKLKFKNELTIPQLKKLEGLTDCYSEEINKNINLEVTEDYNGLRWDGAEKTNDLEDVINFVIAQMELTYPLFELTGKLKCRGEEIDDIYNIVMENNVAVVKNKDDEKIQNTYNVIKKIMDWDVNDEDMTEAVYDAVTHDCDDFLNKLAKGFKKKKKKNKYLDVIVTFLTCDDGHLDVINPLTQKDKLISKLQNHINESGDDCLVDGDVTMDELIKAEGEHLLYLCRKLYFGDDQFVIKTLEY